MRDYLPIAFLSAACSAATAQPLAITHHATFALPNSTTDQNGIPFTISELSGIDHLGSGFLMAVQDDGGKLVMMNLTFANDGTIDGVTVTGGVSLADSLDFEAVAVDTTGSPRVHLAEEGVPSIRVYDYISGSLYQPLSSPSVFAARRNNRGFESLSLDIARDTLWTATEEALTVDGPASSPTNSTTVRLLEHVRGTSGFFQPTAQFAYDVEPMHGPRFPDNSGRSGLTDLVALPKGTLLALERSFAFASPIFLTRIFEVDPCEATNIAAVPSLIGATYTPATKELLYSGDHANLEGLTLGPQLPDGSFTLIGVIDDGDFLSPNSLVVFSLTGNIRRIADWNGDWIVNTADFIAYLNDFNAAMAGHAATFGSPDIAPPFGALNTSDFLEFLNRYTAACN